MKNRIAYLAWILNYEEKTIIDVPDFNIHIEMNLIQEIGEAIQMAREEMMSIAENLYEEKKPFPEKNIMPFMPEPNAIATYIDIDFDELLNDEKNIDVLIKEDEKRIYSMFSSADNCIEFLKNDKTMALTLTKPKFIHRIRKLAKEKPDEVKIIVENNDGSIYAKMPLSYLHIFKASGGPKKEYTEEEKVLFRERVLKGKEKKGA